VTVISEVDPTWVEPWFFGILMLPPDAEETRTAMLRSAKTQHPEVPWERWWGSVQP
jgi:hypothetical protein